MMLRGPLVWSPPARSRGRSGAGRLGPARPAPLPAPRCRLMEPHGPGCPGSVLFGERHRGPWAGAEGVVERFGGDGRETRGG